MKIAYDIWHRVTSIGDSPSARMVSAFSNIYQFKGMMYGGFLGTPLNPTVCFDDFYTVIFDHMVYRWTQITNTTGQLPNTILPGDLCYAQMESYGLTTLLFGGCRACKNVTKFPMFQFFHKDNTWVYLSQITGSIPPVNLWGFSSVM